VLAKYSYGIYLTHVPVFWLCFWRLQRLPFGWQCALAAALSCLMPFLAYHAIEEPFILLGKRLAERRRQGPILSNRPDSDAKAA